MQAVARRAAAPVFALALFSSAALIFVLQPLFGRMVTPLLGGSPQVWNTSMAFFQAALLLGYLYAHLLSQYVKARTALTQELGREPTLVEVAARLGRAPEQIEDLEPLRQQRTLSLDAPVGRDGTGSLQDVIRDPEERPGGGLAAALRARADLAGVLADLPDQERRVVTQRFGLGGVEPQTLEAIGKQLGVTRERVRQIEAAALKRLGALLAARGVDPSDLL